MATVSAGTSAVRTRSPNRPQWAFRGRHARPPGGAEKKSLRAGVYPSRKAQEYYRPGARTPPLRWEVPLRYLAIALLSCLSLTALAQTSPTPQTQQLPPNFPRKELFGDMFALISYCNFHDRTDHYEIFVALKELGMTSADRAEIMAIRDKNYRIYRDQFDTPAKQEELCRKASEQFFFTKTKRKGVPLLPGSDTEKQPEKIETFGKMLGAILFCEVKLDGKKWAFSSSTWVSKARVLVHSTTRRLRFDVI
jgi:hypothetical protein